MANRTNEDFFDIPALTPTIPAELERPWQQKLNPTDEKGQHVDSKMGRSSTQDINGHQNSNLDFNGAINDNNHAYNAGDMAKPESSSLSGRSGTQITNTQSENLETWDPMGMDYACPTFNCYKQFNILASEPPKQRQSKTFAESPEKKSEDISLYVANIPTQMTQEGLKNLFQGAGKVHSCCVLPPKDPSHETKIGFVTFHSWKEASKAIECYDGFSLGSNKKLRVKVANRKGQRRGSMVSNDDEHSSTEDVNGSDVYGQPCVNGFVGSDMNSNTVPKSTGVDSVKNEQAVPKAISNNTSSSGTPGEERPCTKCSKLSTQRCSVCKAPYCSRDCQKADRVNHKAVCNYGNTKTSTPAAPASQHSKQDDPIAEIDFDCIDISTTNNATADHVTADHVTADHMSNEGSVCREDSQNKNAGRVLTPPVSTPPVSTPPSRVLSQLPPAPTLASNNFRLLVTTVASGDSFWAQVVDDVFCRFIGVTQQMAEMKEESLERVAEPCLGIYCLVRFSLDGCWYRSRVEQLSDDNKVEVLFVDYGNKEWKEAHELYYLPSYFSEIPAQARLFTLSSAMVSQDVEVQKTMLTYLDGMVSGKTLDAEVVPAVVGCNPEVVLREAGSERTMNEIVVEHQRGLESSLGVKPSPQTGEPLVDLSQLSHLRSATVLPQSGGVPREVVTTPPSTPSCESSFKTYMALDVPNEVLPLEKTFDIFVSDISSPSLFWIQLPDTAIDKLNCLSAQLDATYKESAFAEYVPGVGELVVAKFTDKLWYRARVDCIYNNGTLRVTFVDFGNSEDVRLDDLRRITRSLVDIPKVAIRCCLIGVESPSKMGDWPAECMDMCKRLMFNKRCTATVEGQVRDIVMLRVLSSFEPNGAPCDVNKELVTKGYAKSTKPDLAQSNVKIENGASRVPYDAESTKRFATEQLSGPAAPPANDSSRSVVSDNVQNALQNIEPKNKHVVSTVNPQTNSHSAQNQKPTSSVAQTVARSDGGTSQNVTNAGPTAPEPNLPHGKPSRNQDQRFLPQPNIPSGAFDVVVNDIVSGDAFFAQMIDPALVRQLHKCVRDLNEFCEQPPPGAVGNVAVGSLGCARFSLDNVWYRAQVISTEETGYRVRFVDFGNSEVVAADAFRDVPPSSFYDLAPQAISCRLAAVMSGSVGSWGEKSKEMLVKLTRNKRLSCTVLNALSSPYPVKLEEHSGGETIDLAKKLQDSEENTSKSSSSAKSWSRSEFGEFVLGPALASSGIAGTGTEQELVVTDVVHPTYFWAQVALRSNIENLNRLTTDLNEHYNNASYSPFEAKVNTFCACKFSQDNIWYRAFLKSEHPTKGFVVHFVDFGNNEVTTAESLRPLEEQFLAEPFRAILCAMASVEPVEGKFWGKEAIELFQGTVTGNVLKCVVVHKSVSRVFVDVQDPESDDGQSLKTRLIENGLAIGMGSYLFSPKKKSSIDQDQLTVTAVNDGQSLNESEATGGFEEQAFDRDPSLQNNQSCSSNQSGGCSRKASLDNAPQYQAQIPPQDPKKIAPTSDNSPSRSRTASSEPDRVMASQFPFVPVDTENHVRVIVNEVSSPREIYVQVVDADSVAALTALSESLNAQLGNTSQSYTPIPGELCCALFSVDSCWYRVTVRGVDLNTGLAAVHFLDYGNHDNVPFASLRPITPSLAELPFQAREVALAGVVSDGTTWTQNRLDYLKTVLLEKLLMAKVVREVQGVLEMEFYDTSGEEDILINALFTEQGYADPQPQPPTVQSPHFPVIPEVTTTESELEVIVTEVNGPECFYVQNIVPVTIQAFAAMTQEMNSFCESFHGAAPVMNIGETCCAKFACDGQWYRARVEAFLGNGLVRVFYVDFGNREDVDPSGLKPLFETFVCFPAQALQCTLANVQPAQEAWSHNAIEWLKSCILGKRLRARVVGRVDSLLQLELIDTSNPDQDVVINLKMVEMGEGRVA